MTLSKETEVIFDWRRVWNIIQLTHHSMILQHSIKQVLVAMLNMIMHEVATPNRELLEEKLARLEQGKFALLLHQVLLLFQQYFLTFKSGDHVILPDDVYGGTFRLTEQILNRFNIEFTTVDTTKLEQIEGAIQSNTKLIYIETPSNPCFKITDIKAVSKIAEKHELLVAVDNTFMTPLGQSPLLLGADIVIHSATKF